MRGALFPVLFARPNVDPDVALWADAVVANGGTVSPQRAQLLSAYVAALKAASVWVLRDDIWPLAAESATQALTSLKQRRLASSVNSPTFTPDRGYTFNGTSNYLNTNFSPAAHAVAMTGTSMQIAAYERTNVVATTYAAGGRNNTSNQGIGIIPRESSSRMGGFLNSIYTPANAAPVSDSRGLSSVSRTGSTYEAWKDGQLLTSFAPTSSGTNMSTASVYIGAMREAAGNASLPRAASIAYVALGAYLGVPRELAEYSALQTFLTAIGAAV